MRRTSSPVRGDTEGAAARPERTEPRTIAFGRSVLAPVVLAFTSVAALAGAVLALLPTLGRRRPVGRLGPRPADDDGERDGTTDPLVP